MREILLRAALVSCGVFALVLAGCGGSGGGGGLVAASADVPGDSDAMDPDAMDPDAMDPDAMDPDAMDPDAMDPDAMDPDAMDPDAMDPDAMPCATTAACLTEAEDALATAQAALAALGDSATIGEQKIAEADVDTATTALETAQQLHDNYLVSMMPPPPCATTEACLEEAKDRVGNSQNRPCRPEGR